MKKLFLSISFALIFVNSYASSLLIRGESNCKDGETYSFSADDVSLIKPIITYIYGSRTSGNNVLETYQVTPINSNYSYEWLVYTGGRLESTSQSYANIRFLYPYDNLFYCNIYCQATDRRNNLKSDWYSFSVAIDPSYRSSYSLTAAQSYTILNMPGALVIAKTEQAEIFSRPSTKQTISYQLNHLLTGISASKGTVKVGNRIDTSILPNGIYILTLINGSHTETHKIVIK